VAAGRGWGSGAAVVFTSSDIALVGVNHCYTKRASRSMFHVPTSFRHRWKRLLVMEPNRRTVSAENSWRGRNCDVPAKINTIRRNPLHHIRPGSYHYKKLIALNRNRSERNSSLRNGADEHDPSEGGNLNTKNPEDCPTAIDDGRPKSTKLNQKAAANNCAPSAIGSNNAAVHRRRQHSTNRA
jgi:hypothetical protein